MIPWTDVQNAVDRSARAVSRRYGSFVTYEDMAQDGYEWALRHPGRLDHYILPDGTVWGNQLVADLTSLMTKVAKRERDATLGTRPSDQHAYTADVIELVLPALYDPTYRPPALEVRTRGKQDPAASSNWEAMVADVRVAVDTLPTALRRVLLAYYGVAHGWREAAALVHMSKTAANDMGRQAVAMVAEALNGVPTDSWGSPATGSRRILTNAAANALTSNLYEGGMEQ